MKICSKCGKEKGDSQFYADARAKDGRRSECKACTRVYVNSDSYRERNRERARQARKENIWPSASKEVNRLRARRAYQEGRWKKTVRIYTDTMRQHNTKRMQTWRREHPEYREKNRIRMNIRRTQIEDNGGEFTIEEWEALCMEYGNKCLCCGESKPLTIDHVVPVSLGGTSDISNIQPLCQSCNSIKKDRVIDYRNGHNAKGS